MVQSRAVSDKCPMIKESAREVGEHKPKDISVSRSGVRVGMADGEENGAIGWLSTGGTSRVQSVSRGEKRENGH